MSARVPWAKPFLGTALIGLLTLLVYFPAMRGGFIWDDEVTLTDNPWVKAADGLRDIWFTTHPHDYWPLSYSSFWAEWRMWGMNPTGYHVTNVLLHALGAVLLWRVLLRLRILGAWLAALVFAVHPVCVSSAAWISERKNTLSLVFYMLSILWYLRSQDEGAELGGQRAGCGTQQRDPFITRSTTRTRTTSALAPHAWYWLSVLAFAFALLSKTSVVMLPFVLWLCAWWRRTPAPSSLVTPRTPTLNLHDALRTLPFFALSLAAGLVTVWFQQHRAIGLPDYATGPLLERLAAGSWALWFYFYKAVVPVGLTVLYPRWQVNPHAPLSYLPALAWIALLGLCWPFRRRWGRPLLFGLGYFTLTLAPVVGVFDMFYLSYSRVADHWQYLALIGPVTLVAAGLCRGIQGLRDIGWRAARVGGVLVGGGTVALLVCLSWQRATIYADAELLWRDGLKKNPKSWVPHSDLGVALVNKGKLDDGLVLFREAIQISPNEGLPYNNLGMALFEKGKVEEAIVSYRKALSLKPYYYPTHFNLAVALARQQKWQEAADHYAEVLAGRPVSDEAHNNLANILGRLGKTNEGRDHYEQALRFRPDFAEARYNLGEALAARGSLDGAMTHYRKAVESRPTYPNARCRLGEFALAHTRAAEAADHFSLALLEEPKLARAHQGLALALGAQGKQAEAIKHLEDALKIQPDAPEAWYHLGNILLSQGQTNEVVSRFSAALQARPDLAEAHYFLGIVLQQQGKSREAVEHWRRAVKSKPNWVEVLNNLAWLLATHPDPAIRDGAEAVRLAAHGVELTKHQAEDLLDSLAAACAETGRFDDAVSAAQHAHDFALKTGRKDLASEIEKRLARYRAGQPWRE